MFATLRLYTRNKWEMLFLRHEILTVVAMSQDSQTIETLTQALQSDEKTIVKICDRESCIENAKETKPATIIFDSSLSGYEEIEKTLRKEKGLEDVSFILLGEDQDLNSIKFPLAEGSSTQ